MAEIMQASKLEFQRPGTSLAKYEPVSCSEFDRNTSRILYMKLHCITSMKEYQDKSFEELRLEDYYAARRRYISYRELMDRLHTTEGRLGAVEQRLHWMPLPTFLEPVACSTNLRDAPPPPPARQDAAANDDEYARRLRKRSAVQARLDLKQKLEERKKRATEPAIAEDASSRLDELERRAELAALQHWDTQRALEALQRRSDARDQEALMIDADVASRLAEIGGRLAALSAAAETEPARSDGPYRLGLLASLCCNAVLCGALVYRSYRK